MKLPAHERGNDSLQILTVSIHTGVSDGELEEEDLGKKVKRSEDKSVYKHVYSGDVVFNMMRAWQGAIGVVTNEGMVSPAYISAIPNEKIYPMFMNYLLRSKDIIGQINDLSYGVTDFRKRLYWKSFVKVSCQLPSLVEQKKIASILINQDKLITLQEQKVESLKKLKKAYLEKMFPKKGSKYPEYRFKGFTDPWKQRKLGDYCDMYNGDRSSKYPNVQDMVSDGIPFINAGDLENGRVNLSSCNKISKEKYDDLGGAKLQLGDIVYCLRGTLGKNAYIDNFTEGTVASSLVAIRPKNINGRYMFHVINSDIEYRQRIVHDEGAAQPNLSAKNVSVFLIPIPSIDEQTMIAKFLDNLINLITLHQRKLEAEKKKKKALMQLLLTGKVRV